MSSKTPTPSKTFILDLWANIFEFLERLTFYDIILRTIPSTRSPDFERNVGKFIFVESWVLGHLLLSIILSITSSSQGVYLWEIFFIIYGSWRVYEIVIYQINVVFFGQYRAEKTGEQYIIRGALRIVILLLHNFIEILFWFTLFYRNLIWGFGINEINSFFTAFNYSFFTMTTFGHSNVNPINQLGYTISNIQAGIGLFMALIVVSRFISLIPPPKTSKGN